MKNPKKMPGEISPGIQTAERNQSADLHVGKFARHVWRDIGAANPHARRQPFLLIPPAAALCVCQEPQVLSVRKNTHVNLPNLTAKRIYPETATAKPAPG
jgi:hypothetical protein